ncbi:hypothetical protein [Herbaspirillum robiniae]|uniref:hypothetical protein n=1 Tax=Herbaspirillum robiniae TaxID=2014887 RepID=UPI00101AEC68|nr:hypothetical protein [Herbaspirillum robiniae]
MESTPGLVAPPGPKVAAFFVAAFSSVSNPEKISISVSKLSEKYIKATCGLLLLFVNSLFLRSIYLHFFNDFPRAAFIGKSGI